MFKFPLRKPIILITSLGDIKCEIVFAGDQTLHLKNVYRKTVNGETIMSFYDEKDGEIIICDRDKVLGYMNVKEEKPKHKFTLLTFKKGE